MASLLRLHKTRKPPPQSQTMSGLLQRSQLAAPLCAQWHYTMTTWHSPFTICDLVLVNWTAILTSTVWQTIDACECSLMHKTRGQAPWSRCHRASLLRTLLMTSNIILSIYVHIDNNDCRTFRPCRIVNMRCSGTV